MSATKDDSRKEVDVDNELHDLGVDLVDQNDLERSLMEKVCFSFSLFLFTSFIRQIKPSPKKKTKMI